MQHSVDVNKPTMKMSLSVTGAQLCTLFTVKIFCHVVVRTAPGKEPVRTTTSDGGCQSKTFWRSIIILLVDNIHQHCGCALKSFIYTVVLLPHKHCYVYTLINNLSLRVCYGKLLPFPFLVLIVGNLTIFF